LKDFTLKKFERLIKVLKKKGYAFQPYKEYIQSPAEKVILLRHDVDLLPKFALKMAKLEISLDIVGSYYFRFISDTFISDLIIKLGSLGHEIGYHYETVDKVSSERGTVSSERGTVNDFIDKAYELFVKELKMFRGVVDVKTICMHGSPRGKYDNKMIWEKYDYRELGIIGEPYLDIDWNEFGYLTDTGRRWNGDKYSLRDKVNSKYKFDFKTTDDIINNIDKLPDKMMITIHPQRWTNNPVLWTRELVWQNMKNVIKRYKVNSEQ